MPTAEYPLAVRAYRRLLSRAQRNEIERVRAEGWRRLVKVCSHPRSGTHFMEAFLAKNFYADRDLRVESVDWGHWADRRINLDGNPFGKLFGHHRIASDSDDPRDRVVYIYRDGRAVAHSLWRTENFVHPATKRELSFAEFLRTPIDWRGAPDVRAEPTQTIAQHWHEHVQSWIDAAQDNPNIAIVRYEELCATPASVRDQLQQRFFRRNTTGELAVIDRPVGLLPNAATIDSWRSAFAAEDDAEFRAQLPSQAFLWD